MVKERVSFSFFSFLLSSIKFKGFSLVVHFTRSRLRKETTLETTNNKRVNEPYEGPLSRRRLVASSSS